MSKTLGHDSPLETALKQGKLKKGDWFMFTTNDPGKFERPPAVIAEFEGLDKYDRGGTAFSFYVSRYFELRAPTKILNGPSIPNIDFENDHGDYGVGIEKDVFVGRGAIVEGLRQNTDLKSYAPWFEQFEF